MVTAGAVVSELPDVLKVSELSAASAQVLAGMIADLSWQASIFDRAENETELGDLDDSFGPFRITAVKPTRLDVAALVVSDAGFGEILLSDMEGVEIAVVGLDYAFAVEGMRFIPEEEVSSGISVGQSFRNPQTLVREYGTNRIVPSVIGKWLLVEPSTWHEKDGRYRLWVGYAVRALLPALATEIDHVSGSYVFRGPPRLALAKLEAGGDIFGTIGRVGFENLQAAVRWVYEFDREAENRHTLFATEFARTGSAGADTLECLRDNLGHALEGAKIAHAMSVAKVSADNLKALADLRKAVTEETAKITDAVRQVVGALASALAIGIGLIAARIVANAPGLLVLAVMFVVTGYIFVVIYSGHRFAALQRGLRDVWRNQIYRFLSPDEYQKLVIQPSLDAEKTLKRVSWVGGISVALAFLVTAWVALVPIKAIPNNNAGATSPSVVEDDEPKKVSEQQEAEPAPPASFQPTQGEGRQEPQSEKPVDGASEP
ncbi:MAG: hypothetical protein C0456_11385 [Hyphomonas sp.]|nr:hypothetical protein [Hyphomonas sp.]